MKQDSVNTRIVYFWEEVVVMSAIFLSKWWTIEYRVFGGFVSFFLIKNVSLALLLWHSGLRM